MADLMRPGVAIGVLLAGAGIFYSYVVLSPQKRQEPRERVAQEAPRIAQEPQQREVVAEKWRAQIAELAACLAQAEAIYTADWSKACSTTEALRWAEQQTGLWTGPGCPLPKAMFDRVEKDAEQHTTAEKEACYKKAASAEFSADSSTPTTAWASQSQPLR